MAWNRIRSDFFEKIVQFSLDSSTEIRKIGFFMHSGISGEN